MSLHKKAPQVLSGSLGGSSRRQANELTQLQLGPFEATVSEVVVVVVVFGEDITSHGIHLQGHL